jgi:hypothetical protein
LFISTSILPCFIIFYSVLYLAQYSNYATDRSIEESGLDFYYRQRYLSPSKLPDWERAHPAFFLLSGYWRFSYRR